MLSQPFTQLASVVANNVVFECAIARRPIEDLHADLMLCNVATAASQSFRHNKDQKLREQGGAAKVRSRNDSLRKLPLRVALKNRRPSRFWRHPWFGLEGSRVFHCVISARTFRRDCSISSESEKPNRPKWLLSTHFGVEASNASTVYQHFKRATIL